MALPFGWHVHLEVWLLFGGILFAYFYSLRRQGGRLVPENSGEADRPVVPQFETAPLRQKAAFVLGIATLWVASDWPLHELSENYLYSAHMVQHLMITLVAPGLLLVGTPPWMLRTLLRPKPLMWAARRITRPLPALLLFNAVIVLTHWPQLVDATLRTEIAHFTTHFVMFGAAIIMWVPVLSPLIELPALSYPGRMFYLFLQSIVPTVPASFLTFADSVIYKFYETAPYLWMSTLTDQRVAGLIMKLGGGFILWTVITVMFFRWHAFEESGLDALGWRDVDRELNRVSVTRE